MQFNMFGLRRYFHKLLLSRGWSPPGSFIGGGQPSFFTLSREAAMKISSVFSAVKLISEGIARLPIGVYRRNDAINQFVIDANDPLYNVLRWRPNADFSTFELWRNAIQQMLLHGNAYLLPMRRADDKVSDIILCSPGSVNYDVYARAYIINDPYNRIFNVYKSQDIIHLRNVSVDGYSGESTIAMAARSLGIISLADNNVAENLSNGGRTRGFLSGNAGPQSLAGATERQLTSVGDRVEQDIRNGRAVIPIPEDMKYQPITLTPADAKVLESKEITTRDIARFFRVHPDLLYESSNNTYKAAEIPNVMFLTQTLEPMLVQIELELLTKLIPRQLWPRRTIRFDREAMYSTDLMTKAGYYEKMLSTGIYTVNELRVKEGKRPVEAGDTPLVSANLRELKDIINENSNPK